MEPSDWKTSSSFRKSVVAGILKARAKNITEPVGTSEDFSRNVILSLQQESDMIWKIIWVKLYEVWYLSKLNIKGPVFLWFSSIPPWDTDPHLIIH